MLATVTVATAHEERRWPAWLSAGQDDAVVSVGNTQGAIPLTTLLTSFGDYGKVTIADHLGSITRLVDASGTTVFSASYDAWGKQSVGTTTVKLHRGYCGHEMLSEYGLINMRSALWDASLAKNGRLYDPQLGRFLSPDRSAMPLGSSKNYVQQPDNSQNFNRYSYCLNNPLKYNDPSGEFWHIVIGALVGGVTNLVANWHNIDGFWQGFAAFAAGAGSGAAVAATGGDATASVWSVAGVAAASGAITSATNSVIAQTGKNFSGIENVHWGDVGKNALVGAASGAASGAIGYSVSSFSVSIQGIDIKSPLLKSIVASPFASAAGHVVGGTANGLLEGHSFSTSLKNSFRGIGTSMAIGTAIGVASTLGECYASRINPWNGMPIVNESMDFFEGTRYSDKVQSQMYKDDFHGFPESVCAFQDNGYTILITGGDGIVRMELHIPGSYKGYDGDFIFIKEPDGIINHRFFKPYNK
jgi:RHS repeat-associated protein